MTPNDPRWKTSSYSGEQGDCVELHPDGAVRDSKNPDGPMLLVPLSKVVAAALLHR